ncbi:GNAT family N-acetyltransferase [Dactylosporangium sp. CA-139066]|uniref:GNAT family N-acetyltransferase n=1 Tax=Dactylosporangium sp. CA-139066 TaxID=3239930 RepID=UPI003D94BA3E
MADDDVLDAPIWAALHHQQRGLAEIIGRAARFRPDVAPFCAIAPGAGPEVWSDLAKLAGPGGPVTLFGEVPPAPPGWAPTFDLGIVQLVEESVEAGPDPQAVVLGPRDVPEMLDLVRRTDPGPFRARTIETGTYLGLRHEGALVAMAGERTRPPGWTEVSAVCTDPAYRGRGLGGRLVRAVVHGIRARGERAFLHAAATNAGAIRLYSALGFRLRRDTQVRSFAGPGGSVDAG